MDLTVTSPDGTPIHAEVSGGGPTALVFVHGWLGNARWWDAQRDALAADYTIVQVDLAGHGRSGRDRQAWSLAAYADDLAAVVARLDVDRVVLVGHSMSGAIVTIAALAIARTAMVVLVDTLKNLDQQPPPAQIEAMLDLYQRDLRTAVEQVLPQYLFAATTPPEVVTRVKAEFLAASPALATAVIAPLYRDDYRSAARALQVPVRAINGDLHPTDVAASRRWFADYDVRHMVGVGHYPMLEQPDTFTAELRAVLAELPSTASE